MKLRWILFLIECSLVVKWGPGPNLAKIEIPGLCVALGQFQAILNRENN